VNTNNLIQCLFYLLAMLAVTKPLGWYIAKVYEGDGSPMVVAQVSGTQRR